MTSIEVVSAHHMKRTTWEWAWVAVSNGEAIGVLTVNNFPECTADEDAPEPTDNKDVWDRHGKIAYVYAAVKGNGVGSTLLLHGKDELLQAGLELCGSGVATPDGRRLLSRPDIDIRVSPASEAKWKRREQEIEYWDKYPSKRKGERPEPPQKDLDVDEAERGGKAELTAVAALLGIEVHE
ncbi:hypothetical protein [Rhodococcus globerulus]|uniref:Uncharacterized protein n=1 Tax=Rhodococcus globerulus TaxID=33008 RepID=A0ABU4C492_RHOGO|nr:hypothetical protein [Rhodococcus globerulus]MDV6271091.1 hypothetical protein [Rhodococcus globerulus]